MTENLTGLSWTQLRQNAQAIEREAARREQMEQQAQAGAFAAELEEVKAGTRRADPEHIKRMSPAEVVSAINNGQLVHSGVGPGRRLVRRR